MRWSPESRQSFLRGLGAIDRVVVALYRMLMALVVVALLAVVGYVAVRKPFGAGNQGEYFYFGIAMLIAFGWAASQFVALRKRKSRTWSAVTHRSEPQAGAYTWQLQLGARPSEVNNDAGGGLKFGFSRDFTIPLTSLPASIVPDEAALAVLQREMERGVPIDQACALVQPKWGEWSGLQQRAYCLLAKSLLDQRAHA